MTINPTLPPSIAEFRAVFPEFAWASDEQVQFYIDTAMQWIDVWWFPIDAKLATMYAAAHLLSLHDKTSDGVLSSGSGGSGGGGGTTPVDPEIGKIFVKSVRFRDRMVSYERVGMGDQQQAGGGGSEVAASDEFWESTGYGQIMLSFRRRNVPHIAVI